MTKSLPMVWRDVVAGSPRDGLSSNARLVAFALSRYMNGFGLAWPGRARLADECNLSVPSVDKALDELEDVGYLAVEPPRKRVTVRAHLRDGVCVPERAVMRRAGGAATVNRYQATLPNTANEISCSEWETAKSAALNRKSRRLNSKPGFHEDVEDVEVGARNATPPNGASLSRCQECEMPAGAGHLEDCSRSAAA